MNEGNQFDVGHRVKLQTLTFVDSFIPLIYIVKVKLAQHSMLQMRVVPQSVHDVFIRII